MTRLTSFSYHAIASDGASRRGTLTAPSREAAITALRARGEYATRLAATQRRRLHPRLGPVPLAQGFRALGSILGAGLTIPKALDVLAETAPAEWAPIIPELDRSVRAGRPLSEALASVDCGIPRHILGLIQAGESAGRLTEAVDRAATLVETRVARSRELWSALSYPLVLAVAGAASLLLLIVVVLPRFATLVEGAGHSLPPLTRGVLWFGSAALATLPWAGLAVAVTAVWAMIVLRNPSHRLAWQRSALSIPWAGSIRRSLITANVFVTLSSLLRSGLPLVRGLPHAAAASGDGYVAVRLAAATTRITEGQSLATALASEPVFPKAATKLVGIGEETGQLAEMLDRAAASEADHAQRQIAGMTRLVEPAMILSFGTLIFIVAGAVLQAMYGLSATGGSP